MRRTGLLVVGLLFWSVVVGAGAPVAAQSDEARSLRDGLTECATESRRLGMVILIDTSGSLSLRDPDNLRVSGTQRALEGVVELVEELNSERVLRSSDAESFSVQVKIDGFGRGYDEGDWVQLDQSTLASQVQRAQTFRGKVYDPYTDYREAVAGARQAFEDYEDRFGSESCKLLFWFTDGEYDTDDEKVAGAAYLDQEEVDEILGDDLCAPGGAVDDLRDLGVAVAGLGLEPDNRDLNFSLLASIVDGSNFSLTPRRAEPVEGACGVSPAVGELQVGGIDSLVTGITDALREALILPVLDPSSDELCAEADVGCRTSFNVTRATRAFSLYFRAPTTSGFSAVLESPEGKQFEIGTGSRQLEPGISLTQISSRYRWLRADRDSFIGGWGGQWSLEFSGLAPGDERPRVRFFWDDVEVTEAPSNVRRGEPSTHGAFRFTVDVEDIPNSSGESGALDVLFEALEDDVVVASVTEAFDDWSDIAMPAEFVTALTDPNSGEFRDATRLLVRVTPIAVAVETSAIAQRYDPHEFELWFDDEINVEPLESTPDLFDRTNTPEFPERHATEFQVTFGGEPLRDQTVDATVDVRVVLGGETRRIDGVEVGPDGRFSIPLGVFEELLQPPAAGSNSAYVPGGKLSFAFDVSLSGESASVGRQAPDIDNFEAPVRSGRGLPEIGSISVSPVFGKEDAIVRVDLVPPLEGVGTLRLIDVVSDESFGGSFSVSGATECSRSLGEEEPCEFVLEHDFQGRDPVPLELVFEISGTDVEQGIPARVDSPVAVTVDMDRPDRPLDGLLTSLALLGFFIVVQMIVRALFTTLSARFEPIEGSARLLQQEVSFDPGTGSFRIDSDELFRSLELAPMAPQFEERSAGFIAGSVELRRDWLGTFLSSRRGVARTGRSLSLVGLLRPQRPMMSAVRPGWECYGPEGAYLSSDGAVHGIPGTDLSLFWIFSVPESGSENFGGYGAPPVQGQLLLAVDVRVNEDQMRRDLFERAEEVRQTVSKTRADIIESRRLAKEPGEEAADEGDWPSAVPAVGGDATSTSQEWTTFESESPTSEDGPSGWV